MIPDVFTATPTEQLLLWMSEAGVGSWRRFKEAHAWVFRQHQDDDAPAAGYVATHLAERGHAEFDWQQQRWAVAPPVLTTVPGLQSAALAVGCRTRTILEAWTALDWPDVYLDINEEPHLPPAHRGAVASRDGVRSVFVIADDVDRPQVAADAMYAKFVWEAGPAIATRLPTLTSQIVGAKRLPPPPDADISVFNAVDGNWHHSAVAVDPGLYRFRPRRIGGTEFRLITSYGSLRIDRSVGIYAELARAHVDALWYEPADVHGFLHVRASSPLPDCTPERYTSVAACDPTTRP